MERIRISLKETDYGPSNRFEYLDAVEFAGSEMVKQLRSYVGLHEQGPEKIVVKSKKYSPGPGVSILQGEIQRMGIGSKIVISNNTEEGHLIFDLDLIVDEYLLKKSRNLSNI